MSPLCVRNQLLVVALAAFLPCWAMAGVPVASSENRQGRWYWERKIYNETSTLVVPVVAYRASSCYVLETNLPPCNSFRRRRDIQIDATPTVPILSTTAPALEEIGNDNALGALSSHRQARESGDGFVVATPSLHPSSDHHDVQYPTYGATDTEELSRYSRQAISAPDSPAPGGVAAPGGTVASPVPAAAAAPHNASADNLANPHNITSLPLKDTWLERLFLKAYTSTYVVTERSTQWFADPDHMITFSVRGCQPNTMPFEMAKCTESFKVKSSDNAAVIQADPTTSVVVPTSIPPAPEKVN